MLKNYSKGNTNVTYAYDSNGVRLSKTVNDVLHSYFINGTTIYSEKIGNEVYTYLYDATGIAGIRHNDKYYYFLKTQQGDIKYIVDEDGILQAEYVYDAWGNCQILVNGVDITDNSEYNTHIAKVNPFRYRGYYFDTETGLYYLNSRYYDPQTRRFINADDPSIPVLEQATDIGGLNLYSYCLNNPVLYVDPTGHSFVLALILGITALVGMGLTISGVASGNNTLTAVGLTMVAIPALISGGMAISLLTPVGLGVGITTTIAGVGTSLFASAEYQEAFTGNNWILDTGMSEDVYYGLMLATATIATLGTIASGTAYSLQMEKFLQIGKINGVRAQPGYHGIRFTNKMGEIRSLELHSAHQQHGVHLQLNNWWQNHPRYVGEYYRAFSKHFEIFKPWKGWY